MRKIVSKFFWPAFEVVIAGIFMVLVMPKNNYEKLVFTAQNADFVKMMDTTSKFFVNDSLIEDKVLENEEVVNDKVEIEEESNQTVLKEEIKLEETEPVINTKTIDTSSIPILNSYSNLVMTGYGHDCYGCSTGKTASGYYVRDTIYYEDPTFGTVRIVAMDGSIPLYSVVKLSNINGMDPILAIVLDRGGGIGFSKSIQIDLLVESEEVAKATIGKKYNVTCDVLRIGK